MRRAMRRFGQSFGIVFCLLLLDGGGGPAPSHAQGDLVARRARFEQLLKLMNVPEGKRRIELPELQAFLRAKLDVVIMGLRDSGLVATIEPVAADRFVRNQAAEIINRVGRGDGIDENELERFEAAQLNYPFVGTMKGLLPPPPASPPAEGATQSPTAFETLRRFVQVRKSYLDQAGISEPATLSVQHFGSDDETRKAGTDQTRLAVRGAIVFDLWDFTRDWGNYHLEASPVIAIDADVSSDSTAGRDKIVHRLGIHGELARTDVLRGWSGDVVDLTFDYTTNKAYELALLGGTLQYTPNVPVLGIGVGIPFRLGGLAGSFLWRPYLGVTYAEVADDGGIPKYKNVDRYVNGFVRIAAELLLGERFRITPMLELYQEFLNAQRGHALFSISGRYSFDAEDMFSLSLTYERGEASPDFVDRDEVRLSLGIKF
jgi:hypothetical protein